MTLRLVPVDSGKAIKLDKPVLLVGRNPDCDVILTDSRKVSRQHCLIACVGHRVFIRDLGSTNGVWVNGHRVERETRMRVGDELSFADLKYELVKGDAEPEERPKRAAEKKPAAQILSEPGFNERETREKNRLPEKFDVRKDRLMALPDQSDSFVVEPSLMRIPRVPVQSDDELPLLSADDEGELPLALLAEADEEEEERPVRKPKSSKQKPPEELLELSEDDLLPTDEAAPPKRRKQDDWDDSEPVLRLDLSDG